MNGNRTDITCEIEVEPGDKLTLPEWLIESIGPGRWVITVRPLMSSISPPSTRDHSAFLNSYAPEDEGLYDDYPSR